MTLGSRLSTFLTLPLLVLSVCVPGLTGAQQAVAPKDDTAPPAPVPKLDGIVVLFSGSADEIASKWTKRNPAEAAAWRVADGAIVARGGDIMSKERFTDFQLHIEFKTPWMPDAKGQGRGNSGVYLQGRYEVQVLDSFGVPEPGKGDCGAVYNIAAPLVKAYKEPLQWQTYDITFRGARVGADGVVTEKARVTVFLNGVAIQNNVEIGLTGGNIDNKVGEPGPILLQDHGNTVQFRNIWVLPLPLKGVDRY